ncbi:nuclear transport factor 2 family protein [Inquilinus limosus]|uniref:nuclear transport factor 2 family protein n=1 Tax=Inquilinus limosus TaxID=171674 RepID=UPI0003FF2DAC|nr:nuclear transport factor 2 family protein [Inquilinus limosus]
MSNATELVDRYIAIWNETDAGRRRALIDATWTEDAAYVDPMMRGDGRDAIDAMIAAVQERFPGHRFRRIGPVDEHNGRIRFRWELGPEGAPALVAGTDFGEIAGGLLSGITGFIDHAPAVAA